MSAPLPPLTPLQRAIARELLRRGPLTAPELTCAVRRELDVTDSDVRAALVVLSGRDLVERAGGAWQTTDARLVAAILNADARVSGMRAVLRTEAA